MSRGRATFVCAALAGALVLSACSGDTKVGSDKLLNFEDEVQRRLGEASPTPSSTAKGSPTTSSTGQNPSGTRTPVATKPPTSVTTLQITIQSDTVGTPFNPVVGRVFVGSIVKWVNRDTIARSVEADGGQFSSGSIPPGGSWSYEAKKVGTFNYHDGTRPYAVARLEVLAS